MDNYTYNNFIILIADLSDYDYEYNMRLYILNKDIFNYIYINIKLYNIIEYIEYIVNKYDKNINTIYIKETIKRKYHYIYEIQSIYNVKSSEFWDTILFML